MSGCRSEGTAVFSLLAASRCTRIPEHKSSQSSLLIFDLVYHGTVESLYKDTPTLGLKDTYTHTHTHLSGEGL